MRDLQLLRSSQLAQEELMSLTLGEEDSLSEQTISEVLSRVTEEIQCDEREKLVAEKEAHDKTQADLNKERNEKLSIQQRLYWRCNRRASYFAWGVSAGLVGVLAAGLAASLGFNFENQFMKWAIPSALVILFLLTLVSLIWGSTVKDFHQMLHSRCLLFLLKREEKILGVEVTGIEK